MHRYSITPPRERSGWVTWSRIAVESGFDPDLQFFWLDSDFHCFWGDWDKRCEYFSPDFQSLKLTIIITKSFSYQSDDRRFVDTNYDFELKQRRKARVSLIIWRPAFGVIKPIAKQLTKYYKDIISVDRIGISEA